MTTFKVVDAEFHPVDVAKHLRIARVFQLTVAGMDLRHDWGWAEGDVVELRQLVFQGMTAQEVRGLRDAMLHVALCDLNDEEDRVTTETVTTLAHFPLSSILDKPESMQVFEDTVAVRVDLKWFPRPTTSEDSEQFMECTLTHLGSEIKSVLLRTIIGTRD